MFFFFFYKMEETSYATHFKYIVKRVKRKEKKMQEK